MKIKNNYSGITKDLEQYHEYISKKGKLNLNINHVKESFEDNKRYFLALIEFERSNKRITCKDTENNYKKGLDLFIDLIDGHILSFQDKKKLTGTIGWLAKIHKIRKENEFNEWNKSWWEYGIFKKNEFGQKKIWIIIPIIITIFSTLFFWIFDFNDIKEFLTTKTSLQSRPSQSINSETIIKPYESLGKKK